MEKNAKRFSGSYLITGGAGFIGCHLTRELLSRGCEVVSIDNFENSSRENINEFLLHRHYYFYSYDVVKNKSLLDALVKGADVVIHLAASVGVKNAIENPGRIIEENILGSINMIDLCLEYDKRLLVASTSEVYGWSSRTPFKESDDLTVPNTGVLRFSYALSKIVEEFYGMGYFATSGLDFTVFRLFNVTGVGQNNRNNLVIPNMVSQALSGRKITVYGDGQQSRCFCDAKEAVNAIYKLSIDENSIGQIVNIGSSNSTKILDLARMIKEEAESESEIIMVPYEQVFNTGFKDMESRVPDLTKIKELVGWEPKKGVREIIRKVVKNAKR